MKTLRDYIITETIENLKELEGLEVYGADLAYKIFESANVDGSYTYSTYKAKQWIKSYFDELGEIVEELKNNGLDAPNPFDEPEKFHVVILLEGASYLIGQCQTVNEFWDEEKTLTKKIINKICKELREQKQGKYGQNNGFYD
jgi:hypothetical protein